MRSAGTNVTCACIDRGACCTILTWIGVAFIFGTWSIVAIVELMVSNAGPTRMISLIRISVVGSYLHHQSIQRVLLGHSLQVPSDICLRISTGRMVQLEVDA